jgi:hypothetical protein
MNYKGEEIPDEWGFDPKIYEEYVARHKVSAVSNEKIVEKDFLQFIAEKYDNPDEEDEILFSTIREVCKNG